LKQQTFYVKETSITKKRFRDKISQEINTITPSRHKLVKIHVLTIIRKASSAKQSLVSRKYKVGIYYKWKIYESSITGTLIGTLPTTMATEILPLADIFVFESIFLLVVHEFFFVG
jgi:hypothetical protein